MEKPADDSCPYIPGAEVTLTLADDQVITAKVLDVKTRTMSCVMTIQYPSRPGTHILKLYDRRYATGLREDLRAEPWTPKLDQEYRDFLQTGSQSELFERWAAGYQNDRWYSIHSDESDEDCSNAELELELQFHSQRMCDTETRVYELLHDLQGIHVPKLCEKVTLGSPDDGSNTYLSCPGIIMQYVEGFPLTDLGTELPSDRWQRICDTAIKILHQIQDCKILNKDVNTRSFMVSCSADREDEQIFMLDFGNCFFRDQVRDDREFRKSQAHEDEEGAIGRVMGSKLGDGYVYKRSDRADALSEELMRATSEDYASWAAEKPEEYARWAAERADGGGTV